MKRNIIIRCGMIVLLTGMIALAAGRANAQENQSPGWIQLDSSPYGVASGQTSRVNLTLKSATGTHIQAMEPVVARFQLLDAEGQVIAQSAEMMIAPEKIQFWDVPRDRLPAGEPNGRIQVRVRVLVTTQSFDVDRDQPPLTLTVEVFDSSTGKTVSHIHYNPFITVDYLD